MNEQKDDFDIELRAMKEIFAVLELLNDEQRARVMTYFLNRYQLAILTPGRP